MTATLCQTGVLSGAIRIPDTVGNLVITADLRSSKVTCHVDVEAPREGRPLTRVNWLVRQLKAAPDSARVESFVAHGRGSAMAELLGPVRENPASLVDDTGREIRNFRIATTATMGTKRGRGRGAFIDSVLGAVDGFYSDVLGSLRAWSAAPPRLRPTDPAAKGIDEDIPSALSSTDYSSQDDEPSQHPHPGLSADTAAPSGDPEFDEPIDSAEQDASTFGPDTAAASVDPMAGEPHGESIREALQDAAR
jgi:hypothetical protein